MGFEDILDEKVNLVEHRFWIAVSGICRQCIYMESFTEVHRLAIV